MVRLASITTTSVPFSWRMSLIRIVEALYSIGRIIVSSVIGNLWRSDDRNASLFPSSMLHYFYWLMPGAKDGNEGIAE
jgi:hypothetical protein